MLIDKSNQNAVCDIFRMNDNIVATGKLEKITDDYIEWWIYNYGRKND